MRRGPQPFHRAAAQFALIAAAMALTNLFERGEALRSVPVYRSRGKGRSATHHVGGHLRVQRDAAKARNVARNRRAHR